MTVLAQTQDSRRIRFAETHVTEAAQEAVARVLESGWLSTGPEVTAFEAEFAGLVDASYAVATSSCTAAIELALRALRLAPGSRVLTSPLTFCGAVHAIVHAGLRPVLVDIDPTTLMPGPEEVARAVQLCGGVEAVVVVHLAGHPAPVAEVAEAAGLPLARIVEDAAHGPGIRVGDRTVGAISAATCFSFYATKNLPIGEGGMLTTDDPAMASTVQRLRLHGMSADAWRRYLPGGSWRYTVEDAGLKANMSDVSAAIGRAHLREFRHWQERRRQLAARYRAALSSVPGLVLPDDPIDGTHSWHLFVVRVTPEFGSSRDELFDRLAAAGIDCSVHFIPVHHFPYFRTVVDASTLDHLANTDMVAEQLLSLPLHPHLEDADVDRVCEAISDCHHTSAVGGAASRTAP